MKKIKALKLAIAGALLAIAGCKSDELKPIEKDGAAPGSVTITKVETLPGAAKITYTLPNDPDLLYVQAKYQTRTGGTYEFKSSYYNNSIMVEGFSDTLNYDVELRAVDKSGNFSEPVIAKVAAKKPPVMVTYESLKVIADFGGVVINFRNPAKADLTIVVSTPDSLGKMSIARKFYTKRDSASFSLRGYDAQARKFNIQVLDKWQNASSEFTTELTPLYEVQLDKSKFKEMFLPGDSPCNFWGGKMPNVWDGRVLPDIADCCLHTGNAATGVPKFITFDLGVLVQLSRFSQQTVADDKHWYDDVSMKRYEIWGSANPDPNGSFDSWTKLATVTNAKPSGLPKGMLTDDDRTAGLAGDEVGFAADIPKVRYIRIRCLENWSGNTNMVISEVTFWGNDK